MQPSVLFFSSDLRPPGGSCKLWGQKKPNRTDGGRREVAGLEKERGEGGTRIVARGKRTQRTEYASLPLWCDGIKEKHKPRWLRRPYRMQRYALHEEARTTWRPLGLTICPQWYAWKGQPLALTCILAKVFYQKCIRKKTLGEGQTQNEVCI